MNKHQIIPPGRCRDFLCLLIILLCGRAYAEKFMIPVLPDTQVEVNYQPAMFTSQMNWIATNKASSNIAFVIGVGDIIDWDTPDHRMWITASNGYAALDRAQIPYALALGNHDTGAVTNGGGAAPGNVRANLRITTGFNSHFPVSRFPAQQGRYENGKSDNAWCTFRAGNVDWLVLTLELWARQGPIDWAKTVVASHTNHNVIVVMHSHLNGDGSIMQSNGGYGDTSPQSIYNQLISQYPNIIMVLSGHVTSSAWRNDAGVNGNRIYQLLQCYHGGGYVRLLEIDTTARTISARMYSPYSNVTKNDSSMFTFQNVAFVGMTNTNKLVSSAQIDPPGGATLASINPGFPGTGFTSYCGEAFSPKGISEMTNALGVTILNFETTNGFPLASKALNTSGAIFSDSTTVSPFTQADALTSLVTDKESVSVEWRSFDNKYNVLSGPDSTQGAFLIGDRPLNNTMTSGKQGLTFGRIGTSLAAGGAYLTFNGNLSDFSVVLNCSSGSAMYLIALFDEQGVLVGRYTSSSPAGNALHFGIHSPNAIIRSVWIGQATVANGVVIDDLAFVKAPPPSVSLTYSFAGSAATNGWSKTSGATLITNPTFLTIKGADPDSKIYRSIFLPAGNYVMSGTGSNNLRVLLATSWTPSSTNPFAYLPISSSSGWRTDRQYFTAPGGNVFLVAQAVGDDILGQIQTLTISSCNRTPYVYDLPAMKTERPSPSVVRGFMSVSSELTSSASLSGYFSDAVNWGANVIRFQLLPATYAVNTGRSFMTAWPSFRNLILQHVQEAQQAGLKVVIDLHEAPFTEVSNGSPALWARPDLNERFALIWRDLANALRPYDQTVWAFDLLNEPYDTAQLPLPPRQWWPLFVNLKNTIRTVNTNVWLCYETGPGSYFSGFSTLSPIPDSHTIYSAHFYYPEAFTHQGVYSAGIGLHYPGTYSGVYWDSNRLASMLAPADAFQAAWKIPVYVGEFSVVRWGPVPDAANWLRDVVNMFEARGWSWTYHAFREWNGWSLEHDGTYWTNGMPLPNKVNYLTDRGSVIASGLQKNGGPPPGSLRCSKGASSDITLSWPPFVAPYVLETSPALSGFPWTPVTNVASIVSGRKSLSINPTNSEQFFRLRGSE